MLLPVWWFSLGAITAVTGICADLIYHNLLNSSVTIQPGDSNMNFYVSNRNFGNQQQAAAFKMDTITYGLPMLIALVLVTGADSWRSRFRALAVSLLAMFLLTLAVVMLKAKVTSLELDGRIAAATMQSGSSSAGFLSLVVHGYAFSQPVVAVLIWFAVLLLGIFKDKPKSSTPQVPAQSASIARNAPCPCGSGRKYKRCCGRT